MANGNWWDKYKTGGTAVAVEEDSEPEGGNWWDKYKETSAVTSEPEEEVVAAEQPQENWWDKYKVKPEAPQEDPNKKLLSDWDATTKDFTEKRKTYDQLGAKYQELGSLEARTPEQEKELQDTWNSLLNTGFSLQSSQEKVAQLQPEIDQYNERQRKARIDYIENRRGSGVFGDEGANALYELDARAQQEYKAARAIEDDQKRKEAVAAIQAKYQTEEKTLNNQFIERFKENETKINNAAELINEASENGVDVGTYLVETLGSPEEYRELQDSVFNQDDPEKGKLYREALTMLDLARGQRVKDGPADTWKLGTKDDAGMSEDAKVGIINNEIRVSPLHVWDAEGIKAEIEALDISDAKKQKAIASIPQLQDQATKLELPFLQQIKEFNNFIKDNNLENVSPQQQISQWKNRTEGWLDYIGKYYPQIKTNLASGTLDLIASSVGFLGGAAQFAGLEDIADPLIKTATKTSDEAQKFARISQEIGGPTLFGEFVRVSPQIISQVGLGKTIGGGAKGLGLKPKTISNIGFGSSVGSIMAQSYGGTYISAVQQLEKEKIDSGVDPIQARAEALKEAQLPAALSGAIEGITSFMGGKRGIESPFKEGAGAIKAKINTPAFKAQLPKFFPEVVGGGAVEGVEELIAQLGQSFVEQATFNPNLTTSEIINNSFKALIIGGTSGVTVEGLKYGYDYMRAPSQMARRKESMASMRQSISDVEKEISEAAASSPIGSAFQREYDVTQPSDMAANLGARSVDRTRMTALQEERKQLTELLEDDTISRVARNQLEAKLAAADFEYYNEILVPSRINVVNEQIVDQLEALGATQQTKDSVTALAKIANGLGAESLTGRERVAVGITSVGEGRFLPSKKNPMVEINERGVATVTEAGRLMAENIGMVPLVRMIGLSETTQAKRAEMQRMAEQVAAQKAKTEAKEAAESEEAKRYGPESAEALKRQAEAQPPAGDKDAQARMAQLLKEQEEEQRKAMEALQKKTAPTEPPTEEPPAIPELESLRRVARAEQTPEDIKALSDAGLVEIYKDQPVLTEAGIAALPEAERPRLTPEARKIQIDTGAGDVAAEAISKNLRIGVDQIGPNVKMPEGWTLDGDVYVPPQKQEVVKAEEPPVAPPVKPQVAPPPVAPVTPPPAAPPAGALTEAQAQNLVKAAERERARKPPVDIKGRTAYGPQSVSPKLVIGKTARAALLNISRINLSKIAQTNPNEIMMQDIAAILAELQMPILDAENVITLSSIGRKGRARRVKLSDGTTAIAMPSTLKGSVRLFVHEIGHTITADEIGKYAPRKKVGRGKDYLDALNKAIADPKTPDPVKRLFTLYISTIDQLGITEQYFGAKGIAGTPDADTSTAMAKRMQTKGELRSDLDYDTRYGLANVEEFVSQTFSRPTFRELLKTLKDPTQPSRTMWTAFVEAIQKILQLPEGSMAAAVIEASIDIGMQTVPSKKRGKAAPSPTPTMEAEMAPKPESPLGYGITNVVEDIKRGRTDGPLKAINTVIKQSTELRDRIKRESAKRQKPRARGQASILERIARERSSGKISDQTAQALTDFVNTIRPDAIGDTAISIRGAGNVSNFDFGDSLVSFYLTQDKPELGARIGIHEFWHGLSRFLPKEELGKMSQDYVDALSDYIDKNPWFLAFVGRYSLTPEQYEDYKIFNPTEAETKLAPVRDSQGNITKYQIIYDNESYRYIMLDEWIAENMTDLVREKQALPDTFLGKLAKIFREFMDMIQAKLGIDPYESFYQLVTDPNKKLQLYRIDSVARPFQIYQPQTYDYSGDFAEFIRYNSLAPEPEVREATQKHLDAVANNDTKEAQRLTDEVAKARNYNSENLLFHGTTHIFNVFSKDRSNIENDFGKGYYLTNTEADAQINYAGEGPDLTNRIERLAEQLQNNEDMDEDVAKEKAREILSGGGQRIMRVYVRLENPFNVGGPNETFLDYDTPFDETTEEYGEPTGALADFLDQLRAIIERYSEDSPVDADRAVGNIVEAAFDRGGIKASELIRILKQEDSGIMWASDYNGDSATSEIIREAIEAAGFDGIVDNLVNQKFGSQKRIGKAMAGMGPDTVHTIVFDSSQIKSADAVTRDDQGNVIPLSDRFMAEEEDIRYAPEEEFEIVPEQVEDQIEGTPEASTINVMGEAFNMANEQSAAEGTPEGTLLLETITNAWMNSGRDIKTLENAIIRYTNLSPEVAATLAQAISKQLEIQRGIAEVSNMASKKKEEEPEYRPFSFGKRVADELPEYMQNKMNKAYEVLRNEVSIEEANRVMQSMTVEEAMLATMKMDNGVSMGVRSMMAQIVLRKIMDKRVSTKGKKRDEYRAATEAHVDFIDWVNEYLMEMGQGIQAFSRFSDLGADGILLKVRKDIGKAIDKHITNRRKDIDKIKRDVEDGDSAAFDATLKANKSNIEKAADNAANGEAKKLTIEEQAQKLAQKAAQRVAGEVRRREPDPLSDLVNGHLRKYNKDFLAEARALGVSPETAQKIEESAIKLRDARVAAKSEKERFAAMQEERMKVKRELARENKYIYGYRPTIWEDYQNVFSERLARRLMRDPKKNIPPSLLLFTDRLTENLLGFVPEAERQASTPKSFQAMIEDALNNKERYQEAFNRALEDISLKIGELEVRMETGEKLGDQYKKALAAQEFLERLAPQIQDFPVSDKLVMRFVGQKTKAANVSIVAKYNEWYRASRTQRKKLEQEIAESLVGDVNISNADAVKLARAIVKDFVAKAEERREKALARFKKPKEKSKRLAESPLKKFFELVNMGAMTDQEAYEVMAHRFELPTWDEKFAETIERMALELQDMPEGNARRKMTQNLMAEIARRKGFSLADLGAGFAYSNMLSSTETFLVNLADTLFNNFSNGFANSVADGDWSRMKGLVQGYRKGWREAVYTFKTGLRINMPRLEEKTPLTVELVKYGKKGGVPLESTKGMNALAKTILESYPARVLNAWKIVTRIMEATDAFNYTASAEGQRYAEAAKMAKDEGLQGKARDKRINEILNLGDDKYQAALKQAEQEGYTGADAKLRAIEIQDSAIEPEVRERGFERALTDVYRNMPKGLAGMFAARFDRTIMSFKNPWIRNAFKLVSAPFVITPTNLFNKWLDWSPYGYKRLFWGSGNFIDKDGPYYVAPPKFGSGDFYAQAFKASSSVLVLGMVGGLIKAGLLELIGRGPSDEEERKQWLDDGNKPYTFRFMNGPAISFAYTPWALMLSAMANISNWEKYNKKEDATFVDRSYLAFLQTVGVVMELPFFSGPADLIDALIVKSNENFVSKANKFVEAKYAMLFPNFVRQIDAILDPTIYDSEGIRGMILDKIPFARRFGNQRLNMFGEPIGEDKPLADRLIGRFAVNPKPSRESRILAKYDAYPYMPNPREAVALVNGEKAQMTEEQYNEYARGAGQEFKKWLNANYNPDAEVSEQALERGKKRIHKRLSEIRARWVRKVSIY